MDSELNREQQQFVENNYRLLTDQELAAKLNLSAEAVREFLHTHELRRTKEDWDAINNRDALAQQAENSPVFALPQEGLARLLAPVLLALFAIYPLINSGTFHVFSTPQVFIWEIVILSAFAIWLVGAALVSRVRLSLGAPFVPLALLTALAFGSYFTAKNQPEALLGAFDYAIFFATYFVAVNLFRRAEEIVSAVAVLGAGALLAGLWIFCATSLDPSVNWAGRSSNLPIFGNFSYASAYFIAALPLAVAMIFISRQTFLRYLWIAASAVLGLLVISLQGRTEWFAISVALFIGLILFLWKYPRANQEESQTIRKVAPVILLGVVVLAGAIIWFTPGIKNRLVSAFDPDDPTRRVRVCIWNNTLDMAKENGWWRGCGAGNYMDSIEPHRMVEERILSGFNSMVEKAHNEFLDVLAMFGIPGLLAFALIILAGLWCGWRVISRAPSRRVFWLGLGLTTVIIAQVADGIANNPILYFPTSGYFFWIALGLLAALNKTLAPLPQKEIPGRVGVLRLAVCLAGAWLAVVGLLYFPYGKLCYSFSYQQAKNAYADYVKTDSRSGEKKDRLKIALEKLDNTLAWRPGSTFCIDEKKTRLIEMIDLELDKQKMDRKYLPDKKTGAALLAFAKNLRREWMPPFWLNLLDGQLAFYEERLELSQKSNEEWAATNLKGRQALESVLEAYPYFTEARAMMLRMELLGPPTQEKVVKARNCATEGVRRLEIAAQLLKKYPVSRRTDILRGETAKIHNALADLPMQWEKVDFYPYAIIGDFYQHEVLKIRALGKRGDSGFSYNVEGYLQEDFNTWLRMIRLRNYGDYLPQDARIFAYAVRKFFPKLTEEQSATIINEIRISEEALDRVAKERKIDSLVNGYFYMKHYWREYRADTELYAKDIEALPVTRHAPLITLENTDWTKLRNILLKGESDQVLSPERALWDSGLSPETRKIIKEENPSPERKFIVIRDLNEQPLRSPGFFREEYFKAVPIPEKLRLKTEIANKKQQLDRELEEINFEVMKTVFPDLFPGAKAAK